MVANPHTKRHKSQQTKMTSTAQKLLEEARRVEEGSCCVFFWQPNYQSIRQKYKEAGDAATLNAEYPLAIECFENALRVGEKVIIDGSLPEFQLKRSLAHAYAHINLKRAIGLFMEVGLAYRLLHGQNGEAVKVYQEGGEHAVQCKDYFLAAKCYQSAYTCEPPIGLSMFLRERAAELYLSSGHMFDAFHVIRETAYYCMRHDKLRSCAAQWYHRAIMCECLISTRTPLSSLQTYQNKCSSMNGARYQCLRLVCSASSTRDEPLLLTTVTKYPSFFVGGNLDNVLLAEMKNQISTL